MNSGSVGIMVGGSTIADNEQFSSFIKKIKNVCSLPVILFPNNLNGISKEADAIWFMSLLNSRNPYYITGAQMLGAPIIKKYNLETLSMAYLIIGEGGTAKFIGDANPIPNNKPELAVSYALAASYLGMKYLYLEAGSGVNDHVALDIISSVKKYVPQTTLIVGGGIRNGETAFDIIKNGADIVVTGSLLENPQQRLKNLTNIINGVKKAGSLRRSKSSVI